MNTVKKFLRNKDNIFPIAIISLGLILSLLGISGSSVATYSALTGIPADGLKGEPRPVRSDEWLVNTPFIIGQQKEGYPVINNKVGNGQDMSIVVDVPYVDWSIIFKPQNLFFFIAPFEIAFALKWWFLSVILCLSTYFFINSLFPKNKKKSALISIAFLFSPFIQWWYQSITILPIAYGFLIYIIIDKIITSDKYLALKSLALFYLLICFCLIMYPAFQISIALIISILVAIKIINEYKTNKDNLLTKKRIITFFAPIVAALSVVVIFILQHLDAIKTSLSTIYPGARNITSGGLDPTRLLSWPFDFLLLSDPNPILGTNASEASNFLLIGLLCIPYAIYIAYKKKSNLTKFEKYLIITLSVVTFLILFRMFIPIGSSLFGLLGLKSVPHTRLFIGLGIINVIIIALISLKNENKPIKESLIKSIPLFSLYFFVMFAITSYVDNSLSLEAIGFKKNVLISMLFASICTLICAYNNYLKTAGLALFTIISLAYCLSVHPLQRNLIINNQNDFNQFVSTEEKNNDLYWIANDKTYISSLLLSSGAEIKSGVNTYPQVDMWKEYFPNDEKIYNRFAHIRFNVDGQFDSPSLELIQSDSFMVKIDPCSPILEKMNIGYIVSEDYIDGISDCFDTKKIIKYGQKDLIIYSRKNKYD